MTLLYIDGISAPDEIKLSLKALSKNISFSREVTKGANGHLFFGTNRILEKEVAVKFYYWGSDKIYHAEPRNLAAIKSSNILKIHDAALIDNDWAYFVTEYCINGDLDDHISSSLFSNLSAMDLVSGVLSGLSHLHANRFLHRDLKPSNVYLDDTHQAVIGDFGSLKIIPNGVNVIPVSSNSILYLPPESISSLTYSDKGDLYQVGIVLYQLLGGFLPYDEFSWMSKQELKHYNELSDRVDRSIFVDQCIKLKITKGKILNLKTLPAWVPDSLKRVIRKATNIDPSKRFQSSTAFKTELHRLRPNIPDWYIDNGVPHLKAKTSYKIIDNESELIVQKKRNGDWRQDNSFESDNISDLIKEINKKT